MAVSLIARFIKFMTGSDMTSLFVTTSFEFATDLIPETISRGRVGNVVQMRRAAPRLERQRSVEPA